jgi:hypothetical protein
MSEMGRLISGSRGASAATPDAAPTSRPGWWFRVLAAASAIVGAAMLGVSFGINQGPPPNPTAAQLAEFGQQHAASLLWGSWLQALGPVLIVVFALAIVTAAGNPLRLAGLTTVFGATVLMAVSLIEITFYLSALQGTPPDIAMSSLHLIYAVQHLYFIVGAPALFVPLGIAIITTRVLPPILGYLAVGLGLGFGTLGVLTLFTLVLPGPAQGAAGVQILWWLAAAIVFIWSPRTSSAPEVRPGSGHQVGIAVADT